MTDFAPFDAAGYLTTEEAIAEYLTAATEYPDPEVLLAALLDVAKARGMATVAKAAGLARESLYKALTPESHPRYETISAVMRALGVRFVVVPDKAAESEAFVDPAAEAEEAHADLAIALERKAALDAEIDQRLPAEVSAAILRGASLLTALRKWRGLTQKGLAARIGVSQGYLSSMECKRYRVAPETLDAIANALDFPRAWLD